MVRNPNNPGVTVNLRAPNPSVKNNMVSASPNAAMDPMSLLNGMMGRKNCSELSGRRQRFADLSTGFYQISNGTYRHRREETFACARSDPPFPGAPTPPLTALGVNLQ